MVKVHYQLTHQQLIHLASIIYYQYLEDIDIFERSSYEFNPDFLEHLEKQIRSIQNDTDILELCHEIHKERKLLHKSCSSVRPILHQLNSYTSLLLKSPILSEKRYGYNNMHTKLNKQDAQSLALSLRNFGDKLKEDRKDNSNEKEIHIPNHFIHDLEMAQSKLLYHHTQLANVKARLKEATTENIEHSNQIWDLLHFICEKGEAIFAKTNPAKAKSYQWNLLVENEKKSVMHD